jgi:flagellar biosynthesis chaperone FliJ
MSILVNTHNELEEKVLIAFLNSLRYDYKSDLSREKEENIETFLDQYNKEIDKAEAEIESGDYVEQDYVEKLFANRRKSLNGD